MLVGFVALGWIPVQATKPTSPFFALLFTGLRLYFLAGPKNPLKGKIGLHCV